MCVEWRRSRHSTHISPFYIEAAPPETECTRTDTPR
jgi:hypothetical protein